MKIHVVSETVKFLEGNGVHTSFVDAVELLQEQPDVEVVINNEGYGDVFHSHTYGPYYFWKGRNYKGRRVYTAHVTPDSLEGTFPLSKLLYPFVRWYLKKVYSYADYTIAISPRVEEAIRELGADTEIVRICNPVLLDRWKRTEENREKGRKILGLSGNEFVILGVGQLEGRKAVDDFIDIAEAIPEAAFVWIGGRPFGAMTEGIARLNKRIAEASTHIRFAGMFDIMEMPALYAAGDMLLFPSLQENCPLAPLEAAACGMPVVYRDLKEYTSLYENPYLKAKTNEEFISLVKRLKDDRTFYEEAQLISANLIKQFDKNEIRKKLVELYERIPLPSFSRRIDRSISYNLAGNAV